MADEQAALRMRLRDLAAARVSYGYRLLYVLVRREGWLVNHKRVYRLYQEEGGSSSEPSGRVGTCPVGVGRYGQRQRGKMSAGVWTS